MAMRPGKISRKHSIERPGWPCPKWAGRTLLKTDIDWPRLDKGGQPRPVEVSIWSCWPAQAWPCPVWASLGIMFIYTVVVPTNLKIGTY